MCTYSAGGIHWFTTDNMESGCGFRGLINESCCIDSHDSRRGSPDAVERFNSSSSTSPEDKKCLNPRACSKISRWGGQGQLYLNTVGPGANLTFPSEENFQENLDPLSWCQKYESKFLPSIYIYSPPNLRFFLGVLNVHLPTPRSSSSATIGELWLHLNVDGSCRKEALLFNVASATFNVVSATLVGKWTRLLTSLSR